MSNACITQSKLLYATTQKVLGFFVCLSNKQMQ